MSLFVTRWQGGILLSTITFYGGSRVEWRMQWWGFGTLHPWVAQERERLLRWRP